MELFLAAQRGKYYDVKRLLKTIDPKVPVIEGWNALHIACKNNRLRIVKLLLKYIDINYTTFHGETSLDISCRHGNINLTRYLLSKNAKGKYPMVQACLNNHGFLALMLFNNDFENPLKYACGFGNSELYIYLDLKGIPPDPKFLKLCDPITLREILDYEINKLKSWSLILNTKNEEVILSNIKTVIPAEIVTRVISSEVFPAKLEDFPQLISFYDSLDD